MASAWEPLVLLWFAALQVLVALWWWRGPHVPSMRFALSALFMLNGLATALTAVGQLNVVGALEAAAFFDRWTDLFLFAVALAAIPRRLLPRPLQGTLLTAAALFLALTASMAASGRDPDQREAVLWGAMIATGVALVVPREQGTIAQAKLLIVAVLAMRFVEIAGSIYVRDWFVGGLTLSLDGVSRAICVLALTAGILVTLARAQSDPVASGARPAALLLLGGVFLGVTSGLSVPPRTLLYFNLGLLRPLWVVWILSLLDGSSGRSSRWTVLAVGSTAAGSSLAALALAEIGWGIGGLGALAFSLGVSCTVLALGLRWRLRSRTETIIPQEQEKSRPAFVDARVTLPPDWRERVERAREVHAQLPDSVVARLLELTRWERLILALATVPEDAPAAYERTTPGLHLATHCPYSNIGPELARVNDRGAAICAALHVPVEEGSTRLVERRWGAAEGLRSGRVSLYRLTLTGRRVAEALRKRIGAENLEPESIRAALGESFGLSKSVLR